VRILVLTFGLILVADAMAQTRPATTAPGPATAPTMDELHLLFDQREYHQVIRHAARLLTLKSSEATHDRHELLDLKAEAHLRLGDADLAAKTFEQASEVAVDDAARAVDVATALLVRRSGRAGYIPRVVERGQAQQQPLPIVEPAARKLALRALWADERAAAEEPLTSARSSESIAELVAAARTLGLIRTLELAATGAEDQSRESLDPTLKRLDKNLEKQVKQLADRVEDLTEAANRKRKMGSAYRKRGLGKDEMQELREIIGACGTIDEQVDRLAVALPREDVERFEKSRRAAHEVAARADQTLRADYSGIFDRG
jgi:hypothetical protein